MIVVDTSALVEIFLDDPMAPALLRRFAAETNCVISAANYVETGAVVAARARMDAATAEGYVDGLMRRLQVRIEPLDEHQARVAFRARIAFGKGFGHRAGLNYGDSFAYALAKVRKAPLLFVGNDFIHTDIEPALA